MSEFEFNRAEKLALAVDDRHLTVPIAVAGGIATFGIQEAAIAAQIGEFYPLRDVAPSDATGAEMSQSGYFDAYAIQQESLLGPEPENESEGVFSWVAISSEDTVQNMDYGHGMDAVAVHGYSLVMGAIALGFTYRGIRNAAAHVRRNS